MTSGETDLAGWVVQGLGFLSSTWAMLTPAVKFIALALPVLAAALSGVIPAALASLVLSALAFLTQSMAGDLAFAVSLSLFAISLLIAAWGWRERFLLNQVRRLAGEVEVLRRELTDLQSAIGKGWLATLLKRQPVEKAPVVPITREPNQDLRGARNPQLGAPVSRGN